MNSTRCLRALFAVSLASLMSGCSAIMVSQMPDVNQYSWEKDRTFTRAEVVKELGKPAGTTTLPQPVTSATLAARKHPAFPKSRPAKTAHPAYAGHIANRTARIATIDEYRLRGPVLATSGDLMGAVIIRDITLWTLGLSEVIVFPYTLPWYFSARKETFYLYMAYSASGELVAHRLISRKRNEN